MTFRVQHQIRNNATEIRSYLDDLFTWEEEINNKQGGKKLAKPTTTAKQNKENFPIRGQALEDDSKENNEEDRSLTDSKPDNEEIQNNEETKKALKRDTNSIPNYYEQWDKFAKHDVDKELEKLEVQAGNKVEKADKKLPQPANPMQKTSGAERNTKIVIKGGRTSYNEVESLKEKGNMYFKTHEFDKAIEMYSEAINKGEVQKVNDELKVILYSNRAMTYLKLREYLKAEEDCNCALKLNDKHVKSLVRRGQAKRRLEKYKESLRDYVKAAEVEPENKEIQDEIKALNKKLSTIKEEQKKKLVIPVAISEKPRVTVQVEDYDPEQPTKSEEPQKLALNRTTESTPTDLATENKDQIAPAPVKPSNTQTIDPQTGEATSEFLTLKDVEGKLVKHHEQETEEEAPKQQVHFRLDLNKEGTGYRPVYPPVPLDKKPKKSALKRKRQFGKENQEEHKVKKEAKVSDLKTAKAVLQGKEMWQKQVIEGYEQTVQPKANGKAKEDPKRLINVTTSSEFLNTWKHIKDSDEACEKLLMGQAKPERFTEIFGAGIEFDNYMELIKFAQRMTEKNKKLVVSILDGMSKVKRFDINVKSMLSSEKKVVREIVDKVKGSDEVDQEIVAQVTQKYKL